MKPHCDKTIIGKMIVDKQLLHISGVSNSFSPGAVSASQLPRGPNVILGLCKDNYP